MIGNDVVDIAASRIESNWKRKGFLEKIFIPEEQEFIKLSPDPETYIWILWSMKEAAYKVYNRETGIRAFIPHELACKIYVISPQEYKGVVTCRGGVYHTTTTNTKRIIHTVAVSHLLKDRKVIEIPDNVLKDADRRPYILNTSGFKIPVSKSNHGKCAKVVAFSEHPVL